MEPVKNSKHASRITRFFKSLSPQGSAFRIALIYLIYGILWILTTDLILEWVVGSRYETYVFIQTIKGWVYVAITATFIYFLVAKTLSLYHEANLKVQRVFLVSLGTDYGQGYYLHYPVLVSDIEPLLK